MTVFWLFDKALLSKHDSLSIHSHGICGIKGHGCMFIYHKQAHTHTHSSTAQTKPKQCPECCVSVSLARHVSAQSVTFKPVNSFEGLGLAAEGC